ncbi:dihydroorotase [Mycobacterium sp. SMC-4]|uniref:dihydroorotase n=1 Tax=Mycobacterium sp. SMC-4 TaxID=2857059 RepID=UPI0021B18901|nr:dihydroorotase [Mycobacterium sp. SMC-4]UXA16837.1 dihydroorotase [Mycobacterium sp. SMC-4]
MADWLICNARLVNDGSVIEGDLRIHRDRIAAIGPQLTGRPGDLVVDANGAWVLPGLIDDQVHFREPGFAHKGTINSESRAAVAGGITSFMEMPNTRPPATTLATLADKYALAERNSLANYAFYLGATNDNIEVIRRFTHRDGCGIKIFMGASTGNMLVDDPVILNTIFGEAGTLIVTHCEDTPTVEANLAAEKATYGDALDATRHPHIRSAEACMKSTQLAIGLARRHDARLHVLHVSTAEELNLLESGVPLAHKRITAETCVHFLHFDASDYPRLGNWIKCNPAVKFSRDRQALVTALGNGTLDVLATDHAPHTREEKAQTYERAPAGLPLVQHCLQVAIERVFGGDLSIETLVERACHGPAVLFGLADRGYLREGGYADMVLVDPSRPQRITPEHLLSMCGWSPFEGETMRSTVVSTWVNGHRAWHEGTIDDSVLGRRLVIGRGRS